MIRETNAPSPNGPASARRLTTPERGNLDDEPLSCEVVRIRNTLRELRVDPHEIALFIEPILKLLAIVEGKGPRLLVALERLRELQS